MRAAAQRDADALRVAAQTEVEALRAGAASLPGLRQKSDEELDDVQSSAVAAEEQAVIEETAEVVQKTGASGEPVTSATGEVEET